MRFRKQRFKEKESNRNLRKLCAVKSQGFKADRGTYAANGKGSSTATSEVAGATDGGRSNNKQ